MLESSKEIGKYEEPLFRALEHFFKQQGYTVLTHARLNVAWSNVISDIDVIAISNETIIMVEVKSDHDCFYRGFEQLRKLKGFADQLYIATNRPIQNLQEDKWRDKSIGLIKIDGEMAEIIRPAEHIHGLCTSEVISQLRKKCLVKVASLLNVSKYLPKTEIEKRLRERFDNADLKVITKNIVLCDSNCGINCLLEPFLIASCNKVKSSSP
jgi:Holliday junction resolvase